MKIFNGFSAIFALLLVSVNSQDVESSGKSDFITFFRRIGDILLKSAEEISKGTLCKKELFSTENGCIEIAKAFI